MSSAVTPPMTPREQVNRIKDYLMHENLNPEWIGPLANILHDLLAILERDQLRSSAAGSGRGAPTSADIETPEPTASAGAPDPRLRSSIPGPDPHSISTPELHPHSTNTPELYPYSSYTPERYSHSTSRPGQSRRPIPPFLDPRSCTPSPGAPGSTPDKGPHEGPPFLNTLPDTAYPLCTIIFSDPLSSGSDPYPLYNAPQQDPHSRTLDLVPRTLTPSCLPSTQFPAPHTSSPAWGPHSTAPAAGPHSSTTSAPPADQEYSSLDDLLDIIGREMPVSGAGLDGGLGPPPPPAVGMILGPAQLQSPQHFVQKHFRMEMKRDPEPTSRQGLKRSFSQLNYPKQEKAQNWPRQMFPAQQHQDAHYQQSAARGGSPGQRSRHPQRAHERPLLIQAIHANIMSQFNEDQEMRHFLQNRKGP